MLENSCRVDPSVVSHAADFIWSRSEPQVEALRDGQNRLRALRR